MASVSLFIVLFAALLIPLFMARFRITSTPTAVAEIVVGMLLGPSLFNVVNPGGTLSELSDLGVVVLLFLSGMEIDFSCSSAAAARPSGARPSWLSSATPALSAWPCSSATP